MDILYLAFANNNLRPLEELKREEKSIKQALAFRQIQNHFIIHQESFADVQSMARYIGLFRERLALFHYSGHAGPDALELDGEEAKARGIVQLLSQCPNLKVVFLNGCSTYGQVKLLSEAGVPLIIGTRRPVEDVRAGRFAAQLYQGLANNETVGQAFELALGAALSIDDQLEIVRGIRPSELRTANTEEAWYIVGDAGAQAWRLPSFPFHAKEFVPNELLLDKLVEALSAYDEETNRVRQKEEDGEDVSILDRRTAILKCLPFPISEHVRKLLVPGTANTGDGERFDELTPERLRQMVVVYQTVIELFAFIFLSQLWDEKSKYSDLQLEPRLLKLIRQFLQLESSRRANFDFTSLIRSIGGVFVTSKFKYFLSELNESGVAGSSDKLTELMAKESDFCRSCNFMQSLWRQTSERPLSEQEAGPLCVMAEESLARIISELGFIVRYTFSSVKNINVIKYRHWDQAKFNHRIVRLVQRFVGLEEKQDQRLEYLDNVSVLLLRSDDQTPSSGENRALFLNLTPFVIDENAFNPKANIAKLHFFERYTASMDVYDFRHIYKPKDPLLRIGNQKNFKMLKAQFEAFAETIFNQKMQEAL